MYSTIVSRKKYNVIIYNINYYSVSEYKYYTVSQYKWCLHTYIRWGSSTRMIIFGSLSEAYKKIDNPCSNERLRKDKG